MLTKVKFLVILICVFSILGGAWLLDVNPAPTSAADGGGDPNPAYAKLNIRSGVYNDGQAAFWDLPFMDHFMIFGAKERVRGYRPEQPIAFSHVTHVQRNQMECQYCHWSVSKAAYAAIPEVETCNGCHGALAPGLPPKIAGTTELQQNEIKKIGAAFTAGKPIEWVKVHVQPNYVRFNHKRHVKAGTSCQECHGQVPKMEVVERVTSMKMGWCVDCHRQRGTSIDCYTCHF